MKLGSLKTTLSLAAVLAIGWNSAWAGGESFSAKTFKTANGPFVITAPDNSGSLRLRFCGQLIAQYYNRDFGEGNDRKDSTTVLVRRVRFTLDGRVKDPNISYLLHLSLAPGSLELIDLYLNWASTQDLQLRFGQWKVPFTRYRIQSSQRLTFVDWSIETKYFGAERQLGLALHNDYEKPGKFGYAVGLFTGENGRASHGIGIPIVYGITPVSLSNLSGPAYSAKVHPELALHLSYNQGGILVDSDSDLEGGPLRWSLAFSLARDFYAGRKEDFSLRIAPEALVKYNHLSSSLIYYSGWFKPIDESSEKFAMQGGQWQGAWRLSERWEAAARYAVVDFSDDLLQDSQYRTSQEQEWTIGGTYYIAGHNLKIQTEASLLRHVKTTEIRDDYRVRSQLQVAF
ncbi:MAG: porin [Calditrichota bacterium]